MGQIVSRRRNSVVAPSPGEAAAHAIATSNADRADAAPVVLALGQPSSRGASAEDAAAAPQLRRPLASAASAPVVAARSSGWLCGADASDQIASSASTSDLADMGRPKQSWLDRQLDDRRLRTAVELEDVIRLKDLLGRASKDQINDVPIKRECMECCTIPHRKDCALLMAARQGFLEGARLLLEHGALPNQDNEVFETALIVAVARDDLPMATLLLEHHASPERAAANLLFPVHLAARNRSVQMMSLLIVNRADINLHGPNDARTPMHMLVDQSPASGTAGALKAVAVAMVLLESGRLLINEVDLWGNTVLHVAIEKQHSMLGTEFVKAGVNVNIASRKGRRALQSAILCRNATGSAIATAIITSADGLNINALSRGMRSDCEWQDTALMAAVRTDSLPITELLLLHPQLNADVADAKGQLPLHEAIQNILSSTAESRGGFYAYSESKPADAELAGRQHAAAIAITLIRSGKACVNAENGNKKRPVFLAITASATQVLTALLDKGVDLLVLDSKGLSPLLCTMYVACDAGRDDQAEERALMLISGSNLMCTDQDGNTALHLSAGYKEGCAAAFQALLKNRRGWKCCDVLNSHKATPLHISLYNIYRVAKASAMVKLMIKVGADLNMQDQFGSTAVVLATCAGHLPSLKLLLKAKPSLDTQDGQGNTALICAAALLNQPCLSELLHHTASVVVQNAYGDTALHAALWPEPAQRPLTPGEAVRSAPAVGSRTRPGEDVWCSGTASPAVALPQPKERQQKWSAVCAKALLATKLCQMDAVNVLKETALVSLLKRLWWSPEAAALVTTMLAAGASVDVLDSAGRGALHYGLLPVLGSVPVLPANEAAALLLLKSGTAGVNLVRQDGSSSTALHMAAALALRQTSRELLRRKADASLHDAAGDLALHIAAAGVLKDHKLMALKLIAYMSVAALNQVNTSTNETVLLQCVVRRQLDLVRPLVERGVETDCRDKRGRLALHVAISCVQIADTHAQAAGELEESLALCLLRNKQRLDANLLDLAGDTPLHAAVARQTPPVVEALLLRGADISLLCRASGVTPLYLAVLAACSESSARVEQCALILIKGAGHQYPTALTELRHPVSGFSPMHLAVSCGTGSMTLLEALITAGADPNAKDATGNNVLHAAIGAPSTVAEGASMAVLIVNTCGGMQLEECDAQGQTPLMLGVRGRQAVVVQALFRHGVDANIQDSDGVFPIFAALQMMAADATDERARLDMALALVANASTRLDVQDSRKDTPLHVAVRLASTELIVALVDRAVLVDTLDGEGFTAVHRAVMAACAASKLDKADAELRAITIIKGITSPASSEALDVTDARGNTAALLAVTFKESSRVCLSALLAAGASTSIAGTGDISLLHAAVGRLKELPDAEEMALDIVSYCSALDVDAPDPRQQRPLLRAALGGCLRLVKALLAKGADPNKEDDSNDRPLLASLRGTRHEADAASTAKIAIAAAILSSSIRPCLADAADGKGMTALHLAVLAGSTAIVQQLLTLGVPRGPKNLAGYSPLHLGVNAAVEGDQLAEPCTILLCKGGADLDALDPDGNCALHVVVGGSTNAKPCGTLFQELLACGADPNILSGKGAAPLHLGIRRSSGMPHARQMAMDLIRHRGTLLELATTDGRVDTPATLTVKAEDLLMLEALVMQGVSLTHASGLLHIVLKAVRDGDTDAQNMNRVSIFKVLLAGDADVNAGDAEKSTPLHLCIGPGKYRMEAFTLLVAKVPQQPCDQAGSTALHCAISMVVTSPANAAAMTMALLTVSTGASALNVRNREGACPLMLAVLVGSITTVQALLAQPGIDPNIADARTRTPLIVACDRVTADQLSIVSRLVQHPKTDLKAAHGDSHRTVLHFAVEKGTVQLLQTLLASGRCSLDAFDTKGRTALHEAITQTPVAQADMQLSKVKELLKAGADATLPSKGKPCLHLAIFTGNVLLLSDLLAVASPEQLDDGGMTALMFAADLAGSGPHKAQHLSMAVTIIPRCSKAIIDKPSQAGFSPLMAAVTIVSPQLVRALVAAKCNVNSTDPRDGATMLLRAITAINDGHGSADSLVVISRELLNGGADPNLKMPNSGMTALMAACSGRKAALHVAHSILCASVKPNVNAYDDRKRTALHLLLTSCGEDMSKLADAEAFVREAIGLNCEVPDGTGAPYLLRAVCLASLPLLEALLRRGADSNVPCNNPPLFNAIRVLDERRAGGRDVTLRLLTHATCEVDGLRTRTSGNSVMHLLLKGQHIDLVDAVLGRSSQVEANQLNGVGESVADYVLKHIDTRKRQDHYLKQIVAGYVPMKHKRKHAAASAPDSDDVSKVWVAVAKFGAHRLVDLVLPGAGIAMDIFDVISIAKEVYDSGLITFPEFQQAQEDARDAMHNGRAIMGHGVKIGTRWVKDLIGAIVDDGSDGSDD